MAQAQRGADQRTAHVPRIDQQPGRAEPVADGAQQALGDRDLAGVAAAAAQAGDNRHGARPVAARHHGGQQNEALAQHEGLAVGLGGVIEAHLGAGRPGRAARRQGIVDDQEAAPGADLAPDHGAQRPDQGEQAEPAALQHPVVGLPAEPRRQRQQGLGDVAARRQQGADDQLEKRGPRRLRAGLHDLADPSAKGRREAGLVMRFHGVFGRVV
jgi:hypothetical protein